MRISDWSSDVCSSDLHPRCTTLAAQADRWRGDEAAEASAAHCDLALSAATGEGMDKLHKYIVEMARTLLTREGEAPTRQRQRRDMVEGTDGHGSEAGVREAGGLIRPAKRRRVAKRGENDVRWGR